MFLDSIVLKSFRNYRNATFSFTNGVNFITGLNGVGKSNILEAISVLSNVRSFRNAADKSMVHSELKEHYYIKGVVSEENERSTSYEAAFSTTSGVKKKFKIDGTPVEKLIEYYGKYITVFFSPNDLLLVTGEPEKKRKYIDSIISKNDKRYFRTLSEYRRVVANRNTLLRTGRVTPKDLEVWNELMAEKSDYIIAQRKTFLTKISLLCEKYYASISGEKEPISLRYISSLKSEKRDEIVTEIEHSISNDMRLKTSTRGPHRDSYSVIYGGADCSKYASQGQRRTLAIAIRLAERDIVEQLSGKKSVILVDDIFSELDKLRRHNLIRSICSDNQVIFTLVDTDFLDADIVTASNIIALS